MSFTFKNQFSIGALGESLFYKAHKGTLNKTDGRKGDFTYKATGEVLELKTDTYPMAKTPNFFLERYSNSGKLSNGGPWQALEHGAKHFTYFFVSDLQCFQFDTAQLVARLDKLIPHLKPMEVTNPKYTTIGYRVPRASLSDLYKEYTLTVTVSP